MVEKKQDEIVEEDIVDDETAVLDDELDLEKDLALETDTGEASITDEEAGEVVAEGTGKQVIDIDTTIVPQLEGLQPGDTIELITTFKVIRGDENSVTVEAIDFLPTSELESPEAPAGPEGGAPPPAGPEGGAPAGGLGGLLG